jgi:hypothetical protein
MIGDKGIGYGLLIGLEIRPSKLFQLMILYKRISIDFQYQFLGLPARTHLVPAQLSSGAFVFNGIDTFLEI